MKLGPIAAMLATLAIGMWLVLQPALNREAYDLELRVCAQEIRLKQTDPTPSESSDGSTLYTVVSPPALAEATGNLALSPREAMDLAGQTLADWQARPALERTLLGFFNITSWTNFAWVALGLIGQAAFFGRMFIQWIVSEKSRQSQVPEIFWWLSLAGGILLFTYFVWRVDVVGVLGQSTGMVIYARNLRLIHKERRRAARDAAAPA